MPLNLHQRALPSTLEAQGPEGVPVIIDGAKGVLGRRTGCQAGFTAVGAGINALGNQCTRLVPRLPGLLEADGRVDAHRDAGLLAQPVETEVPLLGALGTDEQCKASGVFEGVVLAGRLRLADSGIGQWHMYISRSRKVEEMYIDAQGPAQPSIRYANYPESLYLKMNLNFVAAGGFRQTAL